MLFNLINFPNYLIIIEIEWFNWKKRKKKHNFFHRNIFFFLKKDATFRCIISVENIDNISIRKNLRIHCFCLHNLVILRIKLPKYSINRWAYTGFQWLKHQQFYRWSSTQPKLSLDGIMTHKIDPLLRILTVWRYRFEWKCGKNAKIPKKLYNKSTSTLHVI